LIAQVQSVILVVQGVGFLSVRPQRTVGVEIQVSLKVAKSETQFGLAGEVW
jgi:hypothetical protein